MSEVNEGRSEERIIADLICVKRNLKTDPELSAYILREMPEVKEIGHSEMMYYASRDGCCENDLKDTIKLVEEKYIKELK